MRFFQSQRICADLTRRQWLARGRSGNFIVINEFFSRRKCSRFRATIVLRASTGIRELTPDHCFARRPNCILLHPLSKFCHLPFCQAHPRSMLATRLCVWRWWIQKRQSVACRYACNCTMNIGSHCPRRPWRSRHFGRLDPRCLWSLGQSDACRLIRSITRRCSNSRSGHWYRRRRLKFPLGIGNGRWRVGVRWREHLARYSDFLATIPRSSIQARSPPCRPRGARTLKP